MMKKRFWLGYFVGALSVVLGLVLVAITYYKFAASEKMEEAIESNLKAPTIVIADSDCYKEFDADLSFSDRKGNSYSLKEFSQKVVFLNLWQTTCIPCIAEMKSINELYLEFKDQGIEFVILSNEPKEKVYSFIDKRQFDFPVYVVDPKVLKSSVFYSATVPQTFVITNKGTLALHEDDPSNWISKESMDFFESLARSIKEN